jgi:nucleotide-binding universal stress UspA family protein
MIHFKPSKILIPVDFSSTSGLAISHGAFTAQLTKSDVYLLHVIHTQFASAELFIPTVSIENQKEYEKKIEEKLNELSNTITKEYGVKVTSIIKSGNANAEINEVAKEIGASLIVMGTHGYSPLENLVIGSTALRVLTKSPCPTLVMSSEANHKGFNKIIIPIDSSAHTRQKVNYTLEFASHFSAAVYAVGILGSEEENLKPQLELILHQIETLAKEKKVIIHTDILTHVKNRANATIEYAKKINADLTIIMTDQDAELSGLFLGPYAQQLIHLSKIPTLAIKPVDMSANDSNILGGTSGS